jgi:DeoR family fructose operon transcriptional repressor
VNAIDADGLMMPDEDEARIKSLMVEKSTHVIAVTDLTKFGERSFMQFAHLEEIDHLIVDGEPSPAIQKACGDAGVAITEART